MDDWSEIPPGESWYRRRFLSAYGASVTGAALLAGCSGDDPTTETDPTGTTDATDTPETTDREGGDVPETATDPPTDTATDSQTDSPEDSSEDSPDVEQTTSDDWERAADEIVSGIEEPSIPDREFPVTEYGAVGDGETDDSAAFEEAIAACTEAGGGRVVVPEGEYVHAGPIHLEDAVELRVTPEATIKFGRDPADYLPVVRTWWEGNELLGRSPLIYARDAADIAVTGGGTLDARSDDETWWPWKELEDDDSNELIRMNRDQVPVDQREFGEGTRLRPPFVQPLNCQRVLLENVTFLDSPFWFVNPVKCEDVTVRNVTTDGQGPNNDGCNPEFTRNVLVENCTFNNGDDNVALKAGRNEDGRRVGQPTERVVVQDCEMKQGHGAVVAGSEMSGGVQDIYARRNVMNSSELGWVLRIKSNTHRGGFVRNWYFWDTEVKNVASGGQHARMNLQYQVNDALGGPTEGDHPPEVGNVHVENVTSEGEAPLFFLRGLDESPVDGVVLRSSSFSKADLGSWNGNVQNIVLEDVDTGITTAETSNDLLELLDPSPSLFDMYFEGVTDAEGETLSAGRPYLELATAQARWPYYVDRDYMLETVPEEARGGTLIQGRNDDATVSASDVPEYLRFEAKTDVSVYVAFHPGGAPDRDGWWPDWRADWERAGTISVSDPYVDNPFVLFRKDFPAGEVVLGPNDADTDSSASYFTIVTEQ